MNGRPGPARNAASARGGGCKCQGPRKEGRREKDLGAAVLLLQRRIGIHAGLQEGGKDHLVDGPLPVLGLEPVEEEDATFSIVVLRGTDDEGDLLCLGETPEGGDERPDGRVVALGLPGGWGVLVRGGREDGSHDACQGLEGGPGQGAVVLRCRRWLEALFFFFVVCGVVVTDKRGIIFPVGWVQQGQKGCRGRGGRHLRKWGESK